VKFIHNIVLFLPYSCAIDKTPRWIVILIAVISGAALLSVSIATLVVVARNQQQNAETSTPTTTKITGTSKILGEAEVQRD
jgi:hypothetical protein